MRKAFGLLLAVGLMTLSSSAIGQVVLFNSFGTNNFTATSTGTGLVGVEDYTLSQTMTNHTSMRFVGGVSEAGDVLDFVYRDTGGNVVTGFSVALPSAGNFIWNITLGTGFGPIATSGTLEMIFDTSRPENATGDATWFVTNDDVAVGSSVGSDNFAFELSGTPIPEPTTAGLLALASLGIVSRRKR